MSDFRSSKILLIGGCISIFIIGGMLILASLVLFKDRTATSVTKFTVTPARSPAEVSSNQSASEDQSNDLSFIPNDTATAMPANTSIQTKVSTNTPSQINTSATPTPAFTAVTGSITGRVLLDGITADGVTLKLEDQDQNTISETVVGSDGIYNFSNLEATITGYNLVFSLEWNHQYDFGQVISWGWVGPIPVANEMVVRIPDFDISLLGFGPTAPEPNASLSATSVSSSSPMQLEWAAYPEATKYWADLVYGQEQTIVWQSPVAKNTSISFDGTLNSGNQIQPGEYYWGVGAQRDLDRYKLTVYGYLSAFTIVP